MRLAAFPQLTPLSLSLSPPRQVNVSLPQETRANGTLYAVVYVHKVGVSPLEDSREVHHAAQLTTYIAPTHTDVQRDTQKVKCNSVSVTVLSYFSRRVIYRADLDMWPCSK